ncbi:MAG: hypothetical protein JW811_09540 [Clostridiales bacterium]|nr:hypothetical protein [Clostridiales bacterium]
MQGCTTGGSDAAAPAATEEAIVSEEPAATEEPAADTREIIMTLAELSQYDGTNGNPAYIAVDGVIYDVSDVPQWRSGRHNGFTAGKDLTEEIKNISPHGVSKLTGLPIVGKLAE